MSLSSVIPHADLTTMNTLALPSQAAYFASVDSVAQLQETLKWWKSQRTSLPVMALGGGSNLVLAGDIQRLVIKVDIQGREEVQEDDQFVWLRIGAGENWHDLVRHCMDFHLWGLENLALIPGNVGAAPIQNIGAYGVELCELFAELTAVEISSGVSVTFDRDACHFGYRDSVFKQRLRDRYIITSVTLKLRKEADLCWHYPALQQYFAERETEPETPLDIFAAVCEVRRSKLPNPAEIANAGSFFKNPVISDAQYQQLQQRYPDMVAYPQAGGKVKLAAGWLIDQAGWRGRQQGAVGVHERQALVLTHDGCGTGADLLALADDIKSDIYERYGVELEIEPRVYLGRPNAAE
ncbi:UDP-N-acetylmuramate dehydrogenase [Pseudomaricurvus alkylphenolicus]|uniref:UDP-N-acetylmuramate dehydrogenase n=1 Tax=Pseudomaricurvus alkylphenolicus TaxID=1306991 RepID=UPI0030B8AE0A